MHLILQTGGPGWAINSAAFWGPPGDVGVVQLFESTLDVLNAEASAAEHAGLGCNLRNAESTYKLEAYVRPWYAILELASVQLAFFGCHTISSG